MVLTEEQFENLPVIIYVPLTEELSAADGVEVPKAIETDTEGNEEISVSSDPELGKWGTIQTTEPPKLSVETAPPTTETVLAEPAIDGHNEKTPTVPGPTAIDLSPPSSSTATQAGVNAEETAPSFTRCTECSICIDDFEPGDILIILPRCQHAFHKDCIKPWVLERQGRCPLCKTGVLQDDKHETDSDQSADSSSDS
jgi:hypothetical protein